MKKEKLTGGNVSEVYRVGETVQRKKKENAQQIQEVLLHLEKKGYPFSPRFLGYNQEEYEILTYIEGEAGNDPVKTYMWSDAILIDIAKMLKQYHQAIKDFPLGKQWIPIDGTPPPYEILCHNDFALYNIIFNKQKPVGIIDFDVLAPGPRVWDIAYTLYTCIPLSEYYLKENNEKVYYDKHYDALKRKKRIELFLTTYGCHDKNILEVVIQRIRALQQTIIRKAEEGDIAFLKMITDGHVEHYQKEITFLKEHIEEWK